MPPTARKSTTQNRFKRILETKRHDKVRVKHDVDGDEDSREGTGRRTARKSTTPRYPQRESSVRSLDHQPSSSSRRKTTTPKRTTPGSIALKEISRLQNTTSLLIPRIRFHRLVRELTFQVTHGEHMLYQAAALIALQEATEAYLTYLFEDANLCCVHAKRVTIFPRDMNLAQRLRQEK